MSAEIKEKKHELENIVTDYKYGFKTEHKNLKDTGKGISEAVVREISAIKGEPEWMLNYRLKAYAHFAKAEMPSWGPDLSEINFDEYTYYIKPSEKAENSWEDVPNEIKETLYTIKCGRYIDSLKQDGFPASSNQRVYRNIAGDLVDITEQFRRLVD